MRDRLLVVVYCLLLVAPVLGMRAHLKDHRLDGFVAVAPPSKISLETVLDEDVQHGITAWFEASFAFRNWEIWIDNTILYRLFGEVKWGSRLAIGKDGVLFERDDINYFNRAESELPTPAQIDALADRIAGLQQRLQRDGRALVPIFVPSKTTFYRDKVPALWTRDLGDPRPGTERVYRSLMRALDARHVTYVDAIQLIETADASRDVKWGPGARHWSNYVGCLAVRELLVRYSALTRRPAIDYPCVAVVKPSKRTHSDLDLWRLVNAWGFPRDPVGRDVDHPPRATPIEHPPSAIFISGSFGWVMMGDGELSGRFSRLYIDYYNSSVHSASEAAFPADPTTAKWKEVVLHQDLYVVELNESYVVKDDYFVATALDALAAALP
jgi:hypothetical protein